MSIINQVGALSTAAKFAHDYTGPNFLNDWYLPSINELQNMIKGNSKNAQVANPKEEK